MRVYRRKKWDVTHSLTPKFDLKNEQTYQIDIPELPEKKNKVNKYPKNNSLTIPHRSRKHRLMDERNTEIQKTNRMLYEKIRKIMQKGHTSEKKIQPQEQQQTNFNPYSQFLNTSIKPLSLPQISSNVSTLRSTQSQLNTILDDREKFAEKYFEDLLETRERLKNIHSQEIGKVECHGWKVKVLVLNHGQHVALSGKKGKKQVSKKYIYEKVKNKIANNMQEWVSQKFQFQL